MLGEGGEGKRRKKGFLCKYWDRRDGEMYVTEPACFATFSPLPSTLPPPALTCPHYSPPHPPHPASHLTHTHFGSKYIFYRIVTIAE